MTDTVAVVPLRVRSHVLRLLGDQLVGHDRLAIFELVKNAYDADATDVDVSVDLKRQLISVRDNGHGMTVDVVRNKWLDIGTDSKRGASRIRSNRFGRLPLGEKGVGRLAVQKLGDSLHMVTRAPGQKEVVVDVVWADLIGLSDYVDGKLMVNVTERAQPITFLGEESGTLIEVSALSRKIWTRKDLRDLKRLVVSLESPFKSNDSFSVKLSVPGREEEINDVPDLKELLKRSVWTYEFEIDQDGYRWEYEFSPPKLKGLKARQESSNGSERLEWCDEFIKERKAHASSTDEVPLFVDPKNDLQKIGAIKGKLHIFYRRDEILRLIGDPRQTKQWLRDQAGVRVFRDGIRVYNYGEPDDDWLALNARRINRPTAKLGTDQLVAAIDLDLDSSSGLQEKTNREGFNQDEVFSRFRLIVLSMVEHVEKLHDADRRAIDAALKGDEAQVGSTIKLQDALDGLKAVCEKDNALSKEISPYVKVVEQEIEQVRSVMLNAGMAGMGLALVFHEMDRSIRTLTTLAESGVSADKIRNGLTDLRKMLDSVSALMRQGKARHISIRELIKQVVDLNEVRFQFHGVIISAPILTGESPDFFVTAPQHLLLSTINNLIDNAIHWTGYRNKKGEEKTHKPAIQILTSWSEAEGGVITIVDNGTGFSISAADAVQPFITKRVGGMGLGLYYSQLVMETIGGRLQVGSADEARDYFEIPEVFDGAAVSLFFKKGEE